jgi:hypothetical protein
MEGFIGAVLAGNCLDRIPGAEHEASTRRTVKIRGSAPSVPIEIPIAPLQHYCSNLMAKMRYFSVKIGIRR